MGGKTTETKPSIVDPADEFGSVTHDSLIPPWGRTLSIAVVEDHPDFREALTEAIRSVPGLELLPVCRDLPPALSLLEQVCPDMLLVDLGLPSGSGMQLLRIGQARSAGRCVSAVLTVTGNEDHLLTAIGAGAKGFLFKSDQPDDWCQTIRLLASGQSTVHATLAETLLNLDSLHPVPRSGEALQNAGVANVRLSESLRTFLKHFAAGYTLNETAARLGLSAEQVGRAIRGLYDQLRRPVPGLTPREIQLLQLLNQGHPFKKCAELMGVSESTTKTQAARAYEKLGASNLQSALYEARRFGFVA